MALLTGRTFLETVIGAAREASAGESANRPALLATVDPAYSGSGAPKVTFDGESTLSSKLYAYADSYRPAAGDRVLLVPIGTTYMIVCKVASGETRTPGGVIALAQITTGQGPITSGQATPTDITGLSVAFTAKAGRYYRTTARVEVQSTILNDAITVEICDGANSRLQRCDKPLGAANVAGSLRDELTETLNPGSTTRKLRFFRSSGSGNISVAAASNNIGYILVEDIGGV